MNIKNINNELYEADLRLDSIVWLAGAIEGFSDDDFFEDVILAAHEGASYIHESMKVFAEAPEWAMEDKDTFFEWLYESDVSGFIVKATTPKPTGFSGDGSYSHCGFGYTASTYIYVENIVDVVPVALEWRDAKMKEWRLAYSAEDCSPA
jgi:hypothetical protein